MHDQHDNLFEKWGIMLVNSPYSVELPVDLHSNVVLAHYVMNIWNS